MARQNIEVIIQSLSYNSAHWDLVHAFLKLRRSVFIQKKHWSLVEDQDIEYEQYDRVFDSHYVIAHDNNEILGGARLMRCDAKMTHGSTPYTYMIKDAADGLIDIPHEIMVTTPPTDPQSWEITRMLTVVRNPFVHKAILDGAYDFIKSQGGTSCLFLGPPAFCRMARRMNYTLERTGPVCGDETGRYLVMKFDLSQYRPSTSEG